MDTLKEYYLKVDNSKLNSSHQMNEFRVIWNGIKEIADENGASKVELELLQLEQDIFNISKSVEQGLSPKLKWNGTDKEGNVIELYSPDFRLYGEKEKMYFSKRYKATSNQYLKTEYGLYLLLSGELVRNEDKGVLCLEINTLIDEYLNLTQENTELWSTYMYPAFERWLDAFLILSRAGEPLQIQFFELIKKIQKSFLEIDVQSDYFLTFATFIVNTFTEHSKKVKSIISPDEILAKLESNSAINKEANSIIRISKQILNFSSAFNLKTDTSYHGLIGKTHEEIGDDEIKKERWAGGIKSYEDALFHFRLDKNKVSEIRCIQKIDQNKGKFKMGTVAHRADDDMADRINHHINELIAKDDIIELLIALSGAGVYPQAKFLIEQAKKSAKSNSLMNFVTLQSLDKFGNVTRVYQTSEEREIYHLFMSMNLSCQLGVKVIGETFIRAVREKKLELKHIVGVFMSSWMNEEVSWNRGGELEKMKPVDAVLPGVMDFYNQVSHAVSNSDYEPNYVCCIDSMTLKIEYVVRNICRRLQIPTFKYVGYEKAFMTAEEKPLTGLITELNDFLREDDILLIRYLFNEKGGYNMRNRIAHGLVDGGEYGLANALYAFSVLIRLTGYQFDSEGVSNN